MAKQSRERKQYEQDAMRLIDQMRAWNHVDWQDYLEGGAPGDISIKDIRIKAIQDGDYGTMIIIRAEDSEGKQLVAFQVGSHFVDALASAARRVANKSIKWKDDQYAG